MIKIKILNDIKKLHLKIFGSFPKIVLSNNQEKEAIPTKETQEIVPDKEYDGLSKVIIKPIPDEYIIPQGNLEISQNGTYDVTNYASANVNVPEKQLGTKTITSNGIYKATDDNLDGYSEVEVATSGVDINEYFKSENIDTNDITTGCWHKFIKKIPKLNLNITTTCAKIFHNCKAQEIDVSEFDTSNVLNMQYMFRECSSLTSLDVSNFNTANVTTMEGMFWNCTSLTNLDISNFDTSKVTSMRYMFAGCSKLTSLDISSFDTSKVTNMQSIFAGCSSLISLDLSSFNTSKVTTMQYMFSACSSLTSLDLSNFNTSNVTNMSYMVQNSSKLKNLNISNFDFTKVTNYTNMFTNVPTDCYILVKDATAKEWITSKFPKMTNVHYVGEEG